MDNPYLSPTNDAHSNGDHLPNEVDSSIVALAKSVFLAWERLRIVYILIVGSFTMMLSIPGLIDTGSLLLSFRGIIMVVEGAIVANLCYFAGPIAETYVRWLGYNRKWVRWFLFVAGTLLTAMLALVSLASGLMQDQF